MYSSCLFCHADLGRNEVIECFPVGRRLAFDSANGRFWVICASCKRWNLSPLEERWDAMDACERLYQRTRLRMSTDIIGLARVGEGTELVRLGSALRPEMAAWRFSAQLAARLVLPTPVANSSDPDAPGWRWAAGTDRRPRPYCRRLSPSSTALAEVRPTSAWPSSC